MHKPLEIEPDAWCAFCGDPLPEKEDRDPRRIYCGKWCCDQAHKARIYTEAPMRRGACAECGAAFWTYRSGQRFCSAPCYNRDYRRRWQRPSRRVAHDPRTCPECEQAFIPRRKDAIYCGWRCRNKVAGRRRLAKRDSKG